jgi:hypothetical protein
MKIQLLVIGKSTFDQYSLPIPFAGDIVSDRIGIEEKYCAFIT